MSYLQGSSPENLSARITDKGRKKIAEGNFKISYFQIGDSEYDYAFSEFDGLDGRPLQKVLTPMDRDNLVKYPYKISESTISGTTFGTTVSTPVTDTVRNNVGPAGYVSAYNSVTGSTIMCLYSEVNISNINGTNSLTVTDGSIFTGSTFITVMFGEINGSNFIVDSSSSLVYQVMNIAGNVLTLDRPMPDLSSLSGTVSVICNDCSQLLSDVCNPSSPDVQQDAWNLSTVWSKKPAGLDVPVAIDENLSGYTGNIYVSSKEYFGYNTSLGQSSNTGTTIVNSFGDIIIVPPEEQHSISIIHYSKIGDILTDPNKAYKYEDYIAHDTTDDVEYFEIYIPFLFYHRNTGTTIGAIFFMDSTDYFINSSAIDTKVDQMMYRYLLDEQGIRVGKIFVNHKVIIFDDQEIVAALDYKSNRRHTLPVPRISLIPVDIQCGTGEVIIPVASCGDPIILSVICI